MTMKISDKYLQRKIKLLKRSAAKNRFRLKFGVREYLTDVFAVYLELESKNIVRKAIRRIIKLQKLSSQKTSHPIRVLIDASAGQEDRKQKSRWCRALRYALTWPGGVEKLRLCFKAFGGIAGAARKWPQYKEARRSKNSPATANFGGPTHDVGPGPGLEAPPAILVSLTSPQAVS
jgi:uncharacterized protein (UPF0335 family)